MFDEWTDPYDMDKYIGNLSYTVKSAPSSNQYINRRTNLLQHAVEPSVGQVINTPVIRPTNTMLMNDLELQEKQLAIKPTETFQVADHSTYVDGHDVGSQPKINILRSANRETYCDKKNYISNDTLYIIVATVAFFFMLILYINVRTQLSSMRMSFNMMMHMYCNNMKPVHHQG